VVSEILNSSTSLCLVVFSVPLATSFGIYSDLQITTSGQVSAQLDFEGWAILDIDPFFQPLTDEEVEENGA
jgi:ribosome assembly protein 1